MFFSLLTAVLCCGCAAQRTNRYRLAQLSGGMVLIAPGVRDAAVSKTSLRVVAPEALCAPSANGLRMERRRLIVTRAAILSITPDELFSWTADLEGNGCIPKDSAALFNRRIVDAVPLDPLRRSELLNRQTAQIGANGFVDLHDGDRLRVVSPIPESGPPVGFEIAWYDFEPLPFGRGSRVVASSAETHLGDQVTHNKSPRRNYFRFGQSQRLYRYFVLTRSSANDSNAVLLSGKNAKDLQQATKSFRSDSAAFLRSSNAETFALVPNGVGVNPYVRVKVNGQPTEVPLGSTLRQALGQEYKEEFNARLQVGKRLGGKVVPVEWDHRNAAILDLPIEGGEEIRW